MFFNNEVDSDQFFIAKICRNCGGKDWPYIIAVTRYYGNVSKEDIMAAAVPFLSVKLENKTKL